jgi:hypothetical protein
MFSQFFGSETQDRVESHEGKGEQGMGWRGHMMVTYASFFSNQLKKAEKH